MTHMCKHVIDLSNRFKNIIKNKGVFNDLMSIYCRFEMVTEMFFLIQNDYIIRYRYGQQITVNQDWWL